MRSTGPRKSASCAYATEFRVIFESSKQVIGLGVRIGTPDKFMRVPKTECPLPGASILLIWLELIVEEDNIAFAPILLSTPGI